MNQDQQYLLSQAQDSLSAAKILLSTGYTKDATSRAYYSSFYVVEALLEGSGKSFSSHSAVISTFGRDFANAGIVPVEFHRMLLDAERMRHKADYGRRINVSFEEAQRQIGRAEQFLELGNRLVVLPHYHQLYQKYIKQVSSQTSAQSLTQVEIDQGIAAIVFREVSLEEATLILQQSPLAQVQGGEYVQQILAQARSQELNTMDASSEDELEL